MNNWIDYFTVNEPIDIMKLIMNDKWNRVLIKIVDVEIVDAINKFINHCLNETNGTIHIYPPPQLVFNSINNLPAKQIKVVIIGQDPYHAPNQAMGLSFSVPKGIKIPSSLANIYKNLLKYKHIKQLPTHGDLMNWSKQGVLLLNSTLTVQDGQPNSHQEYWCDFTDYIIEYISCKLDCVVFLIWGKFALGKLKFIDRQKHTVSISSHPSGLSFNKSMGQYPSFSEHDHFGTINKVLVKNEMSPINFDCLYD
jgi:uracil-DNA glycosylase